MIKTIKNEKEVELKYVKLQVAVRYEDEDMANDFPHREGDIWSPTIDLDSGQILDYIDFNINENGVITNWYSNPSIEDFIFED